MEKYVIVDKEIGETPLVALEKYRSQHTHLEGTPMAYAGRLDPMASGKLLILIGDECKNQTQYHKLDKQYEFSILFGISSDTGDVLGITECSDLPIIDAITLIKELIGFYGSITLPYPHFSSKTVRGKPLHVWTLENRLDEIEIPTYTGNIFDISLLSMVQKNMSEIYPGVLEKINTIPTVTEESKALGRDFRRDDVRLGWKICQNMHPDATYSIATFSCICSSGVYMRSLAEEIGKKLNTKSLAYHIHRTAIGKYKKFGPFGFWAKRF